MVSSSQTVYVYAYHLGEHDYRYCGLTTQSPEDHLELYKKRALKEPDGRPLFQWLNTFEESVLVHVLETFENPEEDSELCREREQYWIDRLRAERHKLLNTAMKSSYAYRRSSTVLRPPARSYKTTTARKRRAKQTIRVFRWPAETIAQRFQRSPYFVQENGLYVMGKPQFN